MSGLRTGTVLPAAPLDHVARRVKGQLAAGIYRAHLGHVPVNDEWVGVCTVCWGDGCEACGFTGETA